MSGVFTCGPASVKAIRKGELYYGFHAKFLFSEAHGERVHWLVDSDGNMTPFRVEKRVVGRQISTKAAGTISRLDITDLYKAADGMGGGAVLILFTLSSRLLHLLFIPPSKQTRI